MREIKLPFCAELDCGELVGGFPHEYDACIVGFEDAATTHTPVTLTDVRSGDGAVRIGDITMSLPSDRPMIVRVAADGASWQRSIGGQWFNDSESCIFTTPLPRVLGLRIRGRALALDVTDPKSLQELPAMPLTAIASGYAENMLYMSDDLQVYAFDGRCIVWQSRRLSLDGIDAIHYRDGWIVGAGLDVGGASLPFHIDATTGIVEGGFLGFNIIYPTPTDGTQKPKE